MFQVCNLKYSTGPVAGRSKAQCLSQNRNTWLVAADQSLAASFGHGFMCNAAIRLWHKKDNVNDKRFYLFQVFLDTKHDVHAAQVSLFWWSLPS